jgi:hypothetical protein
MRSTKVWLAVVVLSTITRAQDPVSVNPAIAKVEFENDRIRVLRVHYEPRQKFAMHSHPAKVALCLTQFHTRRFAPDGTLAEGTCPAGTVVWREPETHAVENLDDAPADTVELEFKYARLPAVAVAPSAPAPATEPMLAQLEPHHHVLFENQYVRVMEANIAPGDTTLYHIHARDTLFLHLTDSQTQSQPRGEAWEPVSTSKPGQVEFSADAKRPRTHRAKNAGATPFRVLDIELLP